MSSYRESWFLRLIGWVYGSNKFKTPATAVMRCTSCGQTSDDHGNVVHARTCRWA